MTTRNDIERIIRESERDLLGDWKGDRSDYARGLREGIKLMRQDLRARLSTFPKDETEEKRT